MEVQFRKIERQFGDNWIHAPCFWPLWRCGLFALVTLPECCPAWDLCEQCSCCEWTPVHLRSPWSIGMCRLLHSVSSKEFDCRFQRCGSWDFQSIARRPMPRRVVCGFQPLWPLHRRQLCACASAAGCVKNGYTITNGYKSSVHAKYTSITHDAIQKYLCSEPNVFLSQTTGITRKPRRFSLSECLNIFCKLVWTDDHLL